MARVAAVGLLVLLLVGPAWGQSVILQSGEPAPSEGIFFPSSLVASLVEALRDRETWQAQLETLKAQVVSLEQALMEKDEAEFLLVYDFPAMERARFATVAELDRERYILAKGGKI